MDDNRIKLRVMGISYSPMQNGAFALLLAVEGDSPVRIPVVIGPAEAQAIAMRLESVTTPRPMTHDLFVSFAQAFGVRLQEVFIYRFEDGIYSSEMTFSDGSRTITLDARTSDAIAVAMRARAPIYTTPEIVEETGIELEEVRNDSASESDDRTRDMIPAQADPETMSLEELSEKLKQLIDDEEYEEAARIKAILTRRKNNADDNHNSATGSKDDNGPEPSSKTE
ncbi:MAG: DUF151 domain-containing protein [Bacteroidales bacterium]|nr:DUF151 domain-containing protein [Bacteroidales bacterium]